MNAIEQVIDVLERAERHGSKNDYPEGSRYIKLSETYACCKRTGGIFLE